VFGDVIAPEHTDRHRHMRMPRAIVFRQASRPAGNLYIDESIYPPGKLLGAGDNSATTCAVCGIVEQLGNDSRRSIQSMIDDNTRQVEGFKKLTFRRICCRSSRAGLL
jgi:hypothetical protein